MAEAATYHIKFPRGTDYTLVLPFVDSQDPPQPLDLSGMTFAAQIRRFEDDTVIAAEFAIDTGTPGQVALSVAHADNSLEREYCWDLKITDANGKIAIPIGGPLTVALDVTREA